MSGNKARTAVVLASVLVTLALTSSVTAFDGQRKGFVLGGGIGFAPRVAWSVSSLNETKTAFAGQILIGYGWNRSNIIVWDINPTIFNSDLVNRLHGGAKNRVGQVFDGIAWYHYFGENYRGVFATAAFGRYRFFYQSAGDTQGPAIRVGAGYEIVKQIQLGMYFSTGRTSNSGYTYHREQLTILATGLLY
ncbi:MAG TPA: hypothetical protein VJ983_06920 [candidate division Zixibacteria bacterium]|nr:hypothetical protein [candidate division Zixibacteria bacterium]